MERDNVSSLLDRARTGDHGASTSLIAIVYDELKQIAVSMMRGSGSGRTLQPTALVNEAWLRLAGSNDQWENKAHFFGAAARAMRQVLTEEARRKASLKRAGGARRVTLRDLAVESDEPSIDILALDEAMTALAQVDERLTRMIDLRYFAGCSLEEVGELTGCSLATVKRDWAYARAWLFERMQTAGGAR